MTAGHYERLAALGVAGHACDGITDYPGGVRVTVAADGRLQLLPPAP
jgi:hypothetical protein